MTPVPVTICVLTYGDYFSLASSCIGPILENCNRSQYRLVVGANAVSGATRTYLERLASNGAIDRLHISETNLHKCPMMKRMFSDIDTPYIWWFDDDSYITHRDALTNRLEIAAQAPPETAVWGHVFFFGHENDFNYGMDAAAFVRNSPWYRGKEPPSWTPGGKGELNGDGRWFFATGGCWFARTSAIQALNWPDPRLAKRNDDVFFAEAVRQQGWHLHDIGPLGVAINTHGRRGGGEDSHSVSSKRGCLFIPTFRDSDLLAENFNGRPELSRDVDIFVCDDNFEIDESRRVEELCKANNWQYRRSHRRPHGTWDEDQPDLSGFNFFLWDSITGLGDYYEYVIKIDTDAYPISPDWHEEFARLLCGRTAVAGTPEYRPTQDVASFWQLARAAGYSFDSRPTVMHVQGGIYGFSQAALRELRSMGFLAGKHLNFGEDCYLSYCCWLLGIEFLPTTTIGSWFRNYRPGLENLRELKAIHPLTRSEWSRFVRKG